VAAPAVPTATPFNVKFNVALPEPAKGIYNIIYFPSYNAASYVVPTHVPLAALHSPLINSIPLSFLQVGAPAVETNT
jgi:hypothetical protein